MPVDEPRGDDDELEVYKSDPRVEQTRGRETTQVDSSGPCRYLPGRRPSLLARGAEQGVHSIAHTAPETLRYAGATVSRAPVEAVVFQK